MAEFFKQSNCVYSCWYHLVFATKYRRKIFTDKTWPFFRRSFYETIKRHPDIKIKEINHDRDHVHLLVSIPPKMSVGDAVQILKGSTSLVLRKAMRPFWDKVYKGHSGIWSDGYFVSTTGINAEVIQRYIQHQGNEDCGQAKLDL